ncbi:ABC transporter permease [Yimella sp. cx-573]|nr:ABC transporter permease [Yimella sp. cx-573]
MNAPIIKLGLRSLFGRPRVIALLVLPLLLIAVSGLRHVASSDPIDTAEAGDLLGTLGIGIVLPIVTLVATSTLISSEFDDGSIIYLLTKPVSRLGVVMSKASVVLLAVVGLVVLPMMIAALVLVGTRDNLWLSAGAGTLVSGAAYVGIFAVLATFLKRSIVGCLLYWLLWELTLSGLIPAIKWTSAQAWGASVLTQLADLEFALKVPTWFAALAGVVCLVGGVFAAGRRLASTTISEV